MNCFKIIYTACAFFLIQMLIIVNAYCLQGEVLSCSDNQEMLSPEISLNQQYIIKSFQKELLNKSMPVKFLIHMRPLQLIKDIAKIIKEQEGIIIYASIVSEDGKDIVDIEVPLDEIRHYKKILTDFYDIFLDTSAGARISRKKYNFNLTFLDEQHNEIRPMRLVLFFRDLFANQLLRKDGIAFDIEFERYAQFDKNLPREDYVRIIELLGYSENQKKLLRVANFKEKPIVAKKKKERELTRLELEIIYAHTPDYKDPIFPGETSKIKADNTNLVLSAI